MAVLLNNDGHWHDKWLAALSRHMPSHKVAEYPHIQNQEDIEYALVWKHPYGDLHNYPNLRAIFSLGSGVDHLDADPDLPSAPIFRLIDTAMADDMALYVLYWIIHFQRRFGTYKDQQTKLNWQRYPTPLAPDYHVSVLGLGVIGAHIAKVLANNGFHVSGWSSSPKDIVGVNCVAEQRELDDLLTQTDVLVCCLPLNSSTRNFLGHDTLSKLKPGSNVVNVSRGAVIEDEALLSLLDSEHIAGAALDVFSEEPLPKNSRFWGHPSIHVTPHMSGATNPDTAVQLIARDIMNFERGIMPSYPYNKDREADDHDSPNILNTLKGNL